MTQRTTDALIALRQISRATSSGSRKLAKASGISVSQLIALQEIRRAKCMSPSQLAERMSLSRGTITTLMRKLEGRALVAREADAFDKRRHFFSLTADGEKVLDEAPEMLHEKFTDAFGDLQAWEQAQIITALERVATMIDADELDAAPILDVGDLT